MWVILIQFYEALPNEKSCGRDRLEDLGVDMTIMLERILKKLSVKE
jgi:hypothetical protein